MSYQDLPFELDRPIPHASLTEEDLNSLGKEASSIFLSGVCSLNDAVVKVANRHPDISTHQVRRILEQANSSTFLDLFEKQAGEGAEQKNVEFEIADPKVVLALLEKQASPKQIPSQDADYSADPVKVGHENLAADLALMRAFGVEPSSSSMQKVANGEEGGDPSEGMVSDFLKRHPSLTDAQFHEWAEGKGLDVHKAEEKVYRLAHEALKKEGVNLVGKADKEGLAPSDVPKKQIEMGKKVEREHTEDPAVAEQISLDHLTEFPDYYTRLAKMEEDAKKSLDKEAMAYIRSGRDKGGLVRNDLESASSLETVKQKTASIGQYPDSNPFRDLISTRQRLEKLARDSWEAADRNRWMTKEALDALHQQVSNSLLDGVGMGEIVHAMNHCGEGRLVKSAMATITPMLAKRGFDLNFLRGQMAGYEIEKGASARVPNTDNPLLDIFASYCRLSHEQPRLDKVASDMKASYDQLTSRLHKVMRSPYAAQSV